MNENEMRQASVPWLESETALAQYIDGLVSRQHDYGTACYAASMAATAAFQHVSKRLGLTGFQASCADLDVLRRTRGLEGPFMLLKAEEALYPQYDLRAKVDSFLQDNSDWLAKKAAANLAERGEYVADRVKAHWEKLAGEAP